MGHSSKKGPGPVECVRLTSDIQFLGQKASTGHRQDRECSCVEESRLVTEAPIVGESYKLQLPKGCQQESNIIGP